jgi:hypothetical protein
VLRPGPSPKLQGPKDYGGNPGAAIQFGMDLDKGIVVSIIQRYVRTEAIDGCIFKGWMAMVNTCQQWRFPIIDEDSRGEKEGDKGFSFPFLGEQNQTVPSR